MLIAHYDVKKQAVHPLDDHLKKVEQRAAMFAKAFDQTLLTAVAARVHDIGKVHPAFQAYVQQPEGKRGSVKHALPGAYLISKERRQVPCSHHLLMHFLENIVSGHHRGLYDMDRRWSKRYDDVSDEGFSEEVQQFVRSQVQRLGHTTMPSLAPKEEKIERVKDSLYLAALTRLSLSALVDADWLDTEAFFDETRADSRTYIAPTFETFQQQFQHEMQRRFPASELTQYRQQAEQKGTVVGNFFELSLPTGYGKTFASLAFALEHAKTFDKARIIVALPLTNLTTEMSETYRKLFGEEHVIEDHSSLEVDRFENEEMIHPIQLATENWSRPFVITTTVQLFESLFANRPSKLRKLHRLANSVLILDEYHLLPPHLMEPIFKMLDVMQKHFGVTVLLVSATGLPLTASKVAEKWHLTYEPQPLLPPVAAPKKVRFEMLDPVNEDELLARIDARSTLVIVNTRKQAQVLYRRAKVVYPDRPIYYVATTLAAIHRKQRLQAIHEALANQLRPIVISTQVLEAGVDISFEVLFREFAPLPSIIQAAGRCNRYGKFPIGEVYIVQFHHRQTMSSDYEAGMKKLGELLEEYGVEDVFSSEAALASAYRRVLSNVEYKQVITDQMTFYFETVATLFKMIETTQLSVICPTIEGFQKRWLTEQKTRSWWRKVQPYIVSVPYNLKEQVDEQMVWQGLYDAEIGISLLEGR